MRRSNPTERPNKPATLRGQTTERRPSSAQLRRSPGPAPPALLSQLPPTLPAALLQDAAQNAQFAQSLVVMRRWATGVCQAGVDGLRREFRQIRVPSEPHTAMDRNLKKCRYKDVFCADRTRVILRMPPGESDFIHANWVTGEQLQNTFICSQGPLPHTARDFWVMVWQERVHHIFMLCRTTELNRPKCAQYWPAVQGESMCFGALLVRNEGIQLSRCGNIVATALGLSMGGEVRRIFHRQWATWPDKFVPRHVEPAMRLLDFSRSCSFNPTVVHCSAGIGRTGTLVAIEFILRALHLGGRPDSPAIVKHIRSQRAQAIQTEDQYVYVHYAVLQRIQQFGALMVDESRGFFAEYKEFMQSIGSEPPVPLPAYVEPRRPPSSRSRTRPSTGRRHSGEGGKAASGPAASKKYAKSGSKKRKFKQKTEEATISQDLPPSVAASPIGQQAAVGGEANSTRDPPSAMTATPGYFEDAHQPTTYFDGRPMPAAAARQQQAEIKADNPPVVPPVVVKGQQIDSVSRQVQDEGPSTPRVSTKESHKQQQSTDSDETPTSVFLQPNLAQLAERTPFAMVRNRPQPTSAPTSSSRSPTLEEKPGEERYCCTKKKYVDAAEYTVDQSEKK